MSRLVRGIVGVGAAIVGAVVPGMQFLLVPGLQMAGSALLSPGKPKASKQQQQPRAAAAATMQLGEVPRMALMGRVAVAGSLADAFNYGGKYGTDWEVLVLALADHRCDALEGFYVNDRYVAFTGDGSVDGFGGQLEVYWRPGTMDQAVPDILLQHGPGWTVSDNGAGVAHVVVAYKADDPEAKTDPIWPGGRPRFLWVVRGALHYDARLDGSAGGQGGHRRSDPSTWTWSENPIVCRYSWVRGIHAGDQVGDPSQLLIGRGLSAIEAPPANVFPRANLCDELVDGAPRYRVSALIPASAAFGDVEQDFADACGGTISQPQGSVEVDPGEARGVVVSITDDDLVVGSKVIWNNRLLGEASREWVNTVVARYTEPTLKWSDHAAPVRRDIADIIADGSPREERAVLDFVAHGEQAGRIAEIRRRFGRLPGRAQITLPPRFAGIEEGDWIVWHSPRRFGAQAFTFRVEGWGSGPDWHHRLSLRQISASVYSHTDPLDDGSIAVIPPAPPPIGAPAAGSWAVAAGYQDAGDIRTPVLIVTRLGSDDPAARFVRVEYAAADGAPTDPTVWSDAGYAGPDVMRRDIPVASAGSYHVAISYVVNGHTGDRLILGPVDAGAATYPDGTPVSEVQPAEKGATRGSPAGTKVGDKSVEQLIDEVDKGIADIAGLVETYGTTAAAKASAEAAQRDREAGQEVLRLTQAAKSAGDEVLALTWGQADRADTANRAAQDAVAITDRRVVEAAIVGSGNLVRQPTFTAGHVAGWTGWAVPAFGTDAAIPPNPGGPAFAVFSRRDTLAGQRIRKDWSGRKARVRALLNAAGTTHPVGAGFVAYRANGTAMAFVRREIPGGSGWTWLDYVETCPDGTAMLDPWLFINASGDFGQGRVAYIEISDVTESDASARSAQASAASHAGATAERTAIGEIATTVRGDRQTVSVQHGEVKGWRDETLVAKQGADAAVAEGTRQAGIAVTARQGSEAAEGRASGHATATAADVVRAKAEADAAGERASVADAAAVRSEGAAGRSEATEVRVAAIERSGDAHRVSAGSSATIAVEASRLGKATAANLLPPLAQAQYWFGGADGDPEAQPLNPAWAFSGGRAHWDSRRDTRSGEAGIGHYGAMATAPGRRYAATFRFRVNACAPAGSPVVTLHLVRLTSPTSAGLSFPVLQSLSVAPGPAWTERRFELTAEQIDAPFFRLFLRPTRHQGDGFVYDWSYELIGIEDITESKRSEVAAGASIQASATAGAEATAAGVSAGAARDDRIGAQTALGDAQIVRTQVVAARDEVRANTQTVSDKTALATQASLEAGGHARAAKDSEGIVTTRAGQVDAAATVVSRDRQAAEVAAGRAEGGAQTAVDASAVSTARRDETGALLASTQQAAKLAASVSLGAVNDNPTLIVSTPGGRPDGWTVEPTGPIGEVVPGDPGRRGYRVTSPAGVAAYEGTALPADIIQHGRWVVLEADIRLDSGTLRGAGLQLGNGHQRANVLVFTKEIEAGASAPVGAGVIGRVYRLRRMLQVPSYVSNPTLYRVTDLGGASGDYEAGDAKALTWLRAAVRPATGQEIDTRQIAAIDARLSTTETVIASGTFAAASTVSELRAEYNGTKAAVTQQAGVVAAVDGRTQGFWQVGITDGSGVTDITLARVGGQGVFRIGTNVIITGGLILGGSLGLTALARGQFSRVIAASYSGGANPAPGSTATLIHTAMPTIGGGGAFLLEVTVNVRTERPDTEFVPNYDGSGRQLHITRIHDGGVGVNVSTANLLLNPGAQRIITRAAQAAVVIVKAEDFGGGPCDPHLLIDVYNGNSDSGIVVESDAARQQISHRYIVDSVTAKLKWTFV